MKGIRIVFALLTLALLASCAPTTQAMKVLPPTARPAPPTQTTPARQAAGYPLSKTINVDQPATYPPMPAGVFTYVAELTLRRNFAYSGAISGVVSAGQAGTITRTAAATVILFADGSGLVLTCNVGLVRTQGLVAVEYSVPPGNRGEATVVLVHSLR